jgi:glycosyltransferase involved in cell wall biosynthesis
MTFIFYQNILSIHQSAFLRSLAEMHDVVLVVEEEITEQRKQHGWKVPDFGKTKIIIAPDSQQINELLNTKDAIHTFSGVDAFPLVSHVFRLAVKRKQTVGIMAEPFNWFGLKGKLRFVKYFLFAIRFRKRISFILAVGNRGRWCFEKTGFTKTKIFDWAYFTETPSIKIQNNTAGKTKLLFVGSIDERKNILYLIAVCKNMEIIDQLTIIGKGHLENELQNQIQKTNCQYLGQAPNDVIHGLMATFDCLMLPSVFDGWGAVVNEALMCGVPVIASDNCGASVLLDNKERGYVFSVKKNNLQEIIVNFLEQLPYSFEQRKKIKDWALQSISGEVAANYFIHICEYLCDNKGDRPIVPWLKKNN